MQQQQPLSQRASAFCSAQVGRTRETSPASTRRSDYYRPPRVRAPPQVVPNVLAALTTSFAAISLGAAFGVLVRWPLRPPSAPAADMTAAPHRGGGRAITPPLPLLLPSPLAG